MGLESFFRHTKQLSEKADRSSLRTCSSWTRSKAARRVTTGAHAWQPRLSPDGTRLLAVSAIGPCYRLVEVDQRDGSLHLLFSARDAIVSTPSFSPDGSRVVFEVADHGSASLRVLPLPSPERLVSAGDPLSDFNVDLARVVVGPTETRRLVSSVRRRQEHPVLFLGERSSGLVFNRHRHGRVLPRLRGSRGSVVG